MVVGAPFDGTATSQTGSAFVYEETQQNSWGLVGSRIKPADGIAGDAFGFSVDIDNDHRIVVGARVRLTRVQELLVNHTFWSHSIAFWVYTTECNC